MSKRITAFLKKDFLEESSYKLSFALNIFSVLFSVLGYFFIDKLFGQKISGHLKEFGVNYFAYVLLGMAMFSYIGVGLGSFSARIRSEQVQGTLEAILLSPTKITTILISLGVWNLILATIDFLIYIALGIFLFHIDFSRTNLLSASVILMLTIVSFSGLGILSAAFILVFKKGNPASWIIGNLEGLLGGIYFPVSVLPAWLQVLAKFFPITYAVRAIELAVYQGYSLDHLARETAFLSIFAATLFPASIRVFQYCLKKSRRDGSLGQY